ncbi:MAG TPA: N-acetylglucosamine-6-phosphate deacetylase [Thermomicrobiales bacterium]|nr:N-acetylglucosamine-6-phosphate deacetylase [Thermomicrobiales bacterium]
MPITLANARLVDADRDGWGDLIIDSRSLRAVGPGAAPEGTVVDLDGALVVPGFIDVHVHGGGGFSLHTTDLAEIAAYARWVPATGTTSFLVAVVGVPDGLPEPQLSTAARAVTADGEGAEPLGIHLEGPFINPLRRGAHDPAWLREPHPEATDRILAAADGHLRIVTLAPELPGAEAMQQALLNAGVTVSIGHTDADEVETRHAIQCGARHATHCFNAMRPLLHRDPGPLGAIVEAEEVLGELIADTHHVHPAAMRVLIRALGPGRTVIITDAIAAAGLGNVPFTLGDQPAHVEGGVARLADGTIAGSILTMDQALRNVLALGGLSLSEAVGMLTHNPARAAGVADRKGLLRPGYDADLVILDHDLNVQATICRGHLAHATESWKRRLKLLPVGRIRRSRRGAI